MARECAGAAKYAAPGNDLVGQASNQQAGEGRCSVAHDPVGRCRRAGSAAGRWLQPEAAEGERGAALCGAGPGASEWEYDRGGEAGGARQLSDLQQVDETIGDSLACARVYTHQLQFARTVQITLLGAMDNLLEQLAGTQTRQRRRHLNSLGADPKVGESGARSRHRSHQFCNVTVNRSRDCKTAIQAWLQCWCLMRTAGVVANSTENDESPKFRPVPGTRRFGQRNTMITFRLHYARGPA